MRLKPSSYLILGMVNRGVRTGYAIKQTVDRSTRFFWAASLAQVYPELAALEEDGYLVSADEAHGRRPRKTYTLSEKGRRALDDWLRSERMPHLEFRDEGLLRVFFADSLPPDETLRLVRRLASQAEELERTFRADIVPLAESAPGEFMLAVAREGADYFAWRSTWFRQLEKEIADRARLRKSPAGR